MFSQQAINRSAPWKWQNWCKRCSSNCAAWDLPRAASTPSLPLLEHICCPTIPLPAPGPAAGKGAGNADLWQQCNLAPCFISWPTKQSRAGIESYTILTILPCSLLFHWFLVFPPPPPPYFSGERKMLCILFLKLSPAAIPILVFSHSSPIPKF